MKITGSGTIYKNDYGFTISDHQKQQDGTVNRFYVPVRFKRGLQQPNNKDFVSIEGFTKPYKTKDDKLGMSYFIMDWALISSADTEEPVIEETKQETDPFTAFGCEVTLDDDDLPF